MSMSERVAYLRQQSLETIPTLSTERAELITEFYQQDRGSISTPVFRARAFQYLMEHKTICIHEGELIVGEKGPAPKATPTYPELCCHSLEDLDILNSREKISFAVSPRARLVYQKRIIPFWQGRSMRERIFQEMTNVVDAATLRKAQGMPEQYRDLIVRVAGYSDYFCDLAQALQNEIIERTEHQAF